MPQWSRAHACQAGSAIEERTDLMHRAPVILSSAADEDYHEIGWNVARRKHVPIPVDNDRLLSLIKRLAALESETMDNLVGGRWERAITDLPDDEPNPDA